MSTTAMPTSGGTTNVDGYQSGVAWQPTGATVLGTWRHYVVEIDVPEGTERPQAIQSRLDEVAAQGWELVTMTSVVTHLPAPGGMEGLAARALLLAVFKRYE